MLHYRLHWSCFILFPSVDTSMFMFISVPSVYTSLVMFHFHFISFGCIHITWSFNHIVNFTFQSIPSLEINNIQESLNKFLILDRYSLLEAGTPWFYYSLSLYIKQEIQHGVRRNVLVCSAADVYLFIRPKHMLVNGKNTYISVNHG